MRLPFKLPMQQIGIWVTSVVGGLTSFLLVADRNILNVRNTRWLLIGDTASYYLAWEFFRQTPILQWPLGKNPNFGAGFDSSIVYSDSLPLLALLFKPLGKLIGGNFQYYGWWLLLCFLLQAYFALKIFKLFGMARLTQAVALPFLLLNPAFIDRTVFSGYGHFPLTAHWLLIAAIFLFLNGTTKHRHWLVLVLVALGINFYLFVMVIGFTFAWAVTRVVDSKSRLIAFRTEASFLLLVLVCSAGILFALDGFTSRTFGDSGLGRYRATLLSLFDSSSPTGSNWSVLVSSLGISTPVGAEEGFGYLGTGLIVLSPLAVLALFQDGLHRHIKLAIPLFTVAGFFYALALSPKIAVSGRELVEYELPELFGSIVGVVRATGRFIWVPMYIFTFATIGAVTHLLRHRPKRLIAVLIVATSFQLVDSYTALSDSRERYSGNNTNLLFDDPVWDDLARGRKHLVSIPPLNNDPRWIDLATFAERNDMSTNAAYLSRKDECSFTRLVYNTQRALELRKFESDTLYVITNYPPNPETQKLFEEQAAGSLKNVRVMQVEELTVVYSISTGS